MKQRHISYHDIETTWPQRYIHVDKKKEILDYKDPVYFLNWGHMNSKMELSTRASGN